MGLDFVVRLAVVMIGGNRLAISMGAALVSLEKMKELCTKKGAKLGSARIPVMELKLSGTKESGNVKRLDYCISEAMWPEGPRGWLLFPLIETLGEGSSGSVDKLPVSEGVRREMWDRFRAMYLPSPVQEVFKSFDNKVVEGVERTTEESGLGIRGRVRDGPSTRGWMVLLRNRTLKVRLPFFLVLLRLYS